MATTAVTLNGTTYFVPQPGEQGPTYDQDLTNYLVALATAFPQGGASPSSTFQALVSAGANPATAGRLRLSAADLVDWRNQANTGNDALSLDANDNLNWTSSAASPVYYTGLAQQLTGNPGLTVYVTTPQTAFTTLTAIKFDTVVTDTDLGYATGTGLYTVPTGKPGWYQVNTSVLYTTTGGPANVTLEIVANTVAVAGQAVGAVPTSTALNSAGASWCGLMAAGQTIGVSMAISGGTIQPAALTHFSQMSIKRVA